MKKRILIIVAAIAAAVLLAVGVTLVIVLNNSYLDSMKGYNFNNPTTFNGVEIVEKDGLFYLTREGKKLSKTGYASLVDVNSSYLEGNEYNNGDELTPEDLAYNKANDFALYDYFIATKPDSSSKYYLVTSEGKEIAIKGESLIYMGASLPYIEFFDSVTQEFCVASLKNLDSDLSDNAGEEISLNAYERVKPMKVEDGGVQYDYLIAYNDDVSPEGPKWSFFNADGYVMFSHLAIEYDFGTEPAEPVTLLDIDGKYADTYFITPDPKAKIYSLSKGLVAENVVHHDVIDNTIISALCAPINETLTDAENEKNMSFVFISAASSFTIPNSQYDITQGEQYGNLAWVPERDAQGNTTQTYMLFNVITGASSKCTNGVRRHENGLVVVPNADGSSYSYLDTNTGETLISSKYSDLNWLSEGVLTSATEYAEKTATLGGNLPAAYMHFVAAGKTEVPVTLGFGETIDSFYVTDDLAVYKINSIDSLTSTEYSITKSSLLIPFASSAKTAAYDKIELVDAFASGADIAVAINYETGKYDVIDLANGSIIKSVDAAGADMAKTSVAHLQTINLVGDAYKTESAVEIAIIAIKKIDDNSNPVSTEYIAISRNAPQTEYGFTLSPATVVSLGKNVFASIIYTTNEHIRDNDGDPSKYMVVNYPNKTAVLYKLNENNALEEVTTVPYLVMSILKYGESLDDIYLSVVNTNREYGLYGIDGKQIIAPTFNGITVCEGGEYIIVSNSNNATALYKYKAKNNKLKQVLDFEFDDIFDIGDGAVVTVVGSDYFLYEGNDMVKSERITGIPVQGINISIDAETGKVMINNNVTFCFDGKLYIHRSEAVQIALSENYYNYYMDTGDGREEISSGVKVVNFRDTTGAILETKILYPTAKSNFEFSMYDTGLWYSVASKDHQGVETLVTTESIFTSNDSIINVYKAHQTDLTLAG